jgi:HD-GYP domain-containing protein (c-di-GMP phosphodiesterase class II)
LRSAGAFKFDQTWPKNWHRPHQSRALSSLHLMSSAMHFAELSSVQNRLRLGQPLLFNVRDADKTLLLARGQVLSSTEQLQTLLHRGALVDISELQTAREEILKAPRAQLPKLWQRSLNQVAETLLQANDSTDQAGFRDALDDASLPVRLLIERDPDLAIFQVLQQNAGDDTHYGVHRSMQTAITSYLVAQRLGWDNEQSERAFKVGLTMNVSMLSLQGELARQQTPPTPTQRSELRTHPMRSVRMLELAGVQDAAWLEAVLHHHEHEDGSGYPSGCGNVSDLASLARRADTYTGKLTARSWRDALGADMAGRQMFMADPGHPMTAALVREFGIYPPGCYVRLVSGELAIVTARGPSITTPIVSCLTSATGAALPSPQRVDTSQTGHAVAGVVGGSHIPVHLSLDRLAALVTT